ncbi:MAG: serine/threonine-protein kinase [Gemmatimonadota bacterium]
MKFCPVCGTEYADDIRFCQRDGQTLRSSDPTADLVGQVIADRYHITKKLGEGGMGAVYLAEHVKMGRQSAIKVMGRGMSHDPDAISRFNREAANASRINHPNVCAVYDFGETEDGTIYLAMEFIEGHTLSSLLKETGPLSLRRAADILKQCADGLHAAHELGIVHRDLKPDNIMIVSQKGRDVVKVVDFGIAKAAGGEAGQNVTKTGLVVGTPEYMSPEQLSGDKVDGRSDIYSLGLVFYRTLTDALPFVAETAQETMIKRLTDEPIPLALARPDAFFPAGLQPIMDRALARWPQDRYTTATEFSSDVGRVADTIKETASHTSADTEAKTQVVRPSDVARAKTAAMPATRISSPKTERKVGPVAIGVGVVVLALAGGGFALRGTLFGKGQDAGPVDSSQIAANTDTSHLNLSMPGGDTTALVNHDTVSRTNPPATHPSAPPRSVDTSRTSTTPNTASVPSAADLQRQVTAFIDDIEFTDDPGKRREASRLGRDVYPMQNLPSKLRAEAAFIVGQALMTEASSDPGKRSEAKLWVQRAVDLDRRNAWVQILQGF